MHSSSDGPAARSDPAGAGEADGDRAAPQPSGGGGARPPGDVGLGRVALVLGSSLFLAGMAWPGLVGRLPFGLLLKNHLHMPPQAVAMFWAVGTFAWYVKPLVGLVCDAVPLFGTRRRGYLLTASVFSALAWLAFAVVPHAYVPFVAVMTLLNFGLVVITTVLGGMLVEEGQRHGATGRLNALHSGLDGAMSLIAGPLGGFLAVIAFGWTAGLGALLVGAIAPGDAGALPRAAAPRPARSV